MKASALLRKTSTAPRPGKPDAVLGKHSYESPARSRRCSLVSQFSTLFGASCACAIDVVLRANKTRPKVINARTGPWRPGFPVRGNQRWHGSPRWILRMWGYKAENYGRSASVFQTVKWTPKRPRRPNRRNAHRAQGPVISLLVTIELRHPLSCASVQSLKFRRRKTSRQYLIFRLTRDRRPSIC
jgi:hypothetical protein